MSIYDFDDELPEEDEQEQPKKPPLPRRKASRC